MIRLFLFGFQNNQNDQANSFIPFPDATMRGRLILFFLLLCMLRYQRSPSRILDSFLHSRLLLALSRNSHPSEQSLRENAMQWDHVAVWGEERGQKAPHNDDPIHKSLLRAELYLQRRSWTLRPCGQEHVCVPPPQRLCSCSNANGWSVLSSFSLYINDLFLFHDRLDYGDYYEWAFSSIYSPLGPSIPSSHRWIHGW